MSFIDSERTILKKQLGIGIVMLLGGLMPGGAQAELRSMIIGTGGVTGVYFPAGGAICRLVNEAQTKLNLRCLVESTGGSVENLEALRSGEREFGVVQSDWLYHAYRGTSKFADVGANPELRAILQLHAEPLTLVAREDADIETVQDLSGNRVSLGELGSGQRGLMEVLLRGLGWSQSTFSAVKELPPREQIQALCDDQVDVAAFATGHPNGLLKEVTTRCDSVLVQVTGPVVDRFVEDFPFYRKTTIPEGMYRGTSAPVNTFGVGAMLVTTTQVPDDVVYGVTETILSQLADLQQMHPAFSLLRPEEMADAGRVVPIHDGAQKYLKEVGL